MISLHLAVFLLKTKIELITLLVNMNIRNAVAANHYPVVYSTISTPFYFYQYSCTKF